MKRIGIVGGGVTGLAAAYDLERLTDAQIDLYEAADRVGGKVGTERLQGFVIETGPDSLFSRKEGIFELIEELGLSGEVVEPVRREFSMLVQGRLHRVPAGLVALNGVRPEAVREADFLSDDARARVLNPSTASAEGPDESIRSFFTRRFGDEFTRLVVEPLLAGTHGGDPDRLSMRALYPAYLHEAAPERPTPNAQRSSATFVSFRRGMQALVEALAGALTRTRVHLGTKVQSLDEIEADHLLVALPANRAASLLSSEPAELLRRIEHRSSAIVTFVLPRESVGHPLDGTGFLVPPSEGGDVTGATWSSQKWPGRAPEDTVLMRVFLGGDRASLGAKTDEELVATAFAGIRELLGIEECLMPNAEWEDSALGIRHSAFHFRHSAFGIPPFQVSRWLDALPQYEVGHLDLLAEIDAAMAVHHPRVTLAGTSYRGVGVPDCLRQGREAAQKIARNL